MAKKEYTIKLVIDDTMRPEESSSTSSKDNRPREFVVTINPNVKVQPPVEVAAHELGHVLGHVFKTPGWEADPRVSEPGASVYIQFFGPTPDQKMGMLKSEREAWELAEKMGPISPEGKAFSIGTYENAR